MTLSLVVKVRVTLSSFLASSVLEPRSGLVDELVDAKVSVSTLGATVSSLTVIRFPSDLG